MARRLEVNVVREGEPAPDFTLTDDRGETVTLSSLRGEPVVLYFYPKDDTTGCTMEAREFTALLPQFTKQGVQVVGVSPDSEKSHDRFVAKCSIGFPLISDPDRSLCEAFGVWVEKSMYGRTYMGVERATFLVGADGVVERAWRKVKASGHAKEVLGSL
jgi:thioredoxin-dependent peroxiredoxin